ncbi:hypothetical protein N8H71_22110 [Pseudomonas koreensis]|uniref:hypothetical protein n=1 Tax=Pseudomonas koreensis TaxID=198620 RepID=UPI0021C64B0B|nr:hypothetical protein [Pseudomonas koreensis]MCU0074298.1 hypothetical protein [Pseudomonas koreensis]
MNTKQIAAPVIERIKENNAAGADIPHLGSTSAKKIWIAGSASPLVDVNVFGPSPDIAQTNADQSGKWSTSIEVGVFPGTTKDTKAETGGQTSPGWTITYK